MNDTRAELVIPLHRRGAARAFPAMSLVGAVGAAVWIALARSWDSYLYGGLLLGSLMWIWSTMYAARRVRGRAPLQIVATREGLRSPVWELDWERVDRMRIGYVHGSLKALLVAPMRRDDIRRPESVALKLNSLAANAMKVPEIQILETNVDMPLEEIAAEFERLAGRSLLR